ncbi:hypothetical protein FWD07_02790 [Candidatus Saccharibacteria bacterium]|nr:hypothetical protein [Candidatus Saccharibacteria bacterium]
MASPTKKRPRGRPRTSNGVTIFPVRRNPDISEISRAFIELGQYFSEKRVKMNQKGAKNAGL